MRQLKWFLVIGFLALLYLFATPSIVSFATSTCDPAYPGVCIAPPPPDLDCANISAQNFRVYLPTDTDRPATLSRFDPHRLDGDRDGLGCEPRSR